MKIAIITGGKTGEREISIKSAENVRRMIDFAHTEVFTFPKDVDFFIGSAKKFNLVIPIIHGIGGEDGSVQGLLKTLNIPFIFSDITTHAISIDKKFTKEIVKSLGILSPEEISGFPVFVKPRYGGSSLSSKLCDSNKELEEFLESNKEINFITEELIQGKEFSVGVIDNGEIITPLPVVEIVPKGKFFDFENKYKPDKLATEICPADISKSLSKELQQQALIIHKHLKVRHLSRSDFIVTKENKIYFLEINTIPGVTDTSLIPKMLYVANLSLKDIIKSWCLGDNLLK